MNKNEKDAWKESWIPCVTFILTIVLMWLCSILSGCSTGNIHNEQDLKEIDTLKLQLSRRDLIINQYEQFRTVAIDIYIDQVDSTGDGFDESDKGVDFWLNNAKIDSLLKNL